MGFLGRGSEPPSPPVRGSGERCKPPAGSGADPGCLKVFSHSIATPGSLVCLNVAAMMKHCQNFKHGFQNVQARTSDRQAHVVKFEFLTKNCS